MEEKVTQADVDVTLKSENQALIWLKGSYGHSHQGRSLGMEMPLLLVSTWNSSYGIYCKTKTGKNKQPNKTHPLGRNYYNLTFTRLKFRAGETKAEIWEL